MKYYTTRKKKKQHTNTNTSTAATIVNNNDDVDDDNEGAYLSVRSQVYCIYHQSTRQLASDVDAVTDHCALGVPERPDQAEDRAIPLAGNLPAVTW